MLLLFILQEAFPQDVIPLGAIAYPCPRQPCWSWSELLCSCPKPSRILSEGRRPFPTIRSYGCLPLHFYSSFPLLCLICAGTHVPTRLDPPTPPVAGMQKLDGSDLGLWTENGEGLGVSAHSSREQNLENLSQSPIPLFILYSSLCFFPTLKMSVYMLWRVGGAGEMHEFAKLENEPSELRGAEIPSDFMMIISTLSLTYRRVCFLSRWKWNRLTVRSD